MYTPRVIHNNQPLIYKMDKTTILADFIDKYKNLPKQGSAEWIKGREASFGGSELASLIGKNKNKTCRKLLEEKITGAKFEGNSFTLWGHLFEPVHRSILESVYNTTIYETGSIPWNKEGFKYSPDGVGVVDKEHLTRVINEGGISHFAPNRDMLNNLLRIDDGSRDIIVLFEQKAPANRVLNYAVPEYYAPQVLSGLNVIDISDVGIYTEAIFKRCALDDLSLTSITYNESFKFTKNTFTTRPKFMGVIILSTPDAEFAHQIKTAYFRNKYTSDMYIDYGDSSPEAFFDILDRWKNGSREIQMHYTQGDGEVFYRAFESITDNIIGIIPWKLFDIQNHLIERRGDYLDLCHPAILEGVAVIKQSKEMLANKTDNKKIIDEGVSKIMASLSQYDLSYQQCTVAYINDVTK